MKSSTHPDPPTLSRRLATRARPAGKPVMYQSWQHLLFLHWSCDPSLLEDALPPGLYLDTWADRAWLGVVPFYMRNIRPVWSPSVPGISNFLEMNVRTYVYDDAGRPGVWFYSLDANQGLAVKLARRFFALPYEHAVMMGTKLGEDVHYASCRRGASTHSQFVYRGEGAERLAEPGSFEFFLLERYLLFSWREKQQRLFSGQVVHPPYPVQDAVVDEMHTDALDLNGFTGFDHAPESVLFSPGVQVDVYKLQTI